VTKVEKILKYRPPRIAAFLMAITVAIWFFSPVETILYIPYKLIGSISIIGGFTIMLWAWFQFRKVKTAVCPTAETTTVVTNGVYSICRNPMYLGMLLILTGISFFMGAVQAFFAPAVFFVIMDKVFIPYEEEKLLKGYETHYAEYMNQTRRWL
jgi:protein-S-isoprenylcysteine O-methyltransferase Ste14